MAPTFTVLEEVRGDPHTIVHGTITFDGAYQSGGESVVASDFGLWGINWIWTTGADDAKTRGSWDSVNSQMRLYIEDGDGKEVVATGDQSAVVLPVIVVGVK